MAVDKNLFLYDLAVVAIMKNEGPYIKEWLDYHLLAGVNHFYIYDNESLDNMKKVLQPYIEREIVTYTFYPGKQRQMEAYNDAVKKYRFFCRYMAFIDGDEFIFPQSNRSIVEVLDEILSDKPMAGGLGINWHCFGSNSLEKADYSHGVLERFTRRAPSDWSGADYPEKIGGNAHIKTIANPRLISLISNPHFAFYFEGYSAISEKANTIPTYFNYPVTADKIIINHYHTKSREEYEKKIRRGNADSTVIKCTPQQFLDHDHNEIFDDGILKYCAAKKNEPQKSNSDVKNIELYNALSLKLAPTSLKNIGLNFFQDKMETFLICRALALHMREKVLDEISSKFFEEAALNAVYKTLQTNLEIADLRLLFSELPEILPLDYPVVEKIRAHCLKLIPQILDVFRFNNFWQGHVELQYLMNMLKVFDNYMHK